MHPTAGESLQPAPLVFGLQGVLLHRLDVRECSSPVPTTVTYASSSGTTVPRTSRLTGWRQLVEAPIALSARSSALLMSARSASANVFQVGPNELTDAIEVSGAAAGDRDPDLREWQLELAARGQHRRLVGAEADLPGQADPHHHGR